MSRLNLADISADLSSSTTPIPVHVSASLYHPIEIDLSCHGALTVRTRPGPISRSRCEQFSEKIMSNTYGTPLDLLLLHLIPIGLARLTDQRGAIQSDRRRIKSTAVLAFIRARSVEPSVSLSFSPRSDRPATHSGVSRIRVWIMN